MDPWVGKIPWRRKRVPTPVFWPVEFHGLCSPWDHKESDTTEQLLLSAVFVWRIPWTEEPGGLQSVEFSRPEYWSGWSFPSPEYLPDPGIKPSSPALQMDSLPAEPKGKLKNTGVGNLSLLHWIFPTQESNQGLLHCRWILYQLSFVL